MRIRSIKPEFWRSEDIATLGWETRLLFVGLWSYVDDNGVGRDSEQVIVADLFALDSDYREALARVQRGLEQLNAVGLIDRYMVDGRGFLYITGWTKHQRIDRPSPARYPGPDQGFPAAPSKPRETLASGSRLEQRNRGTEEQRKELLPTASQWASSFDAFYVAYPRKVGKEAARKAFAAAIRRGVTGDQIVAGAERFAADPNLPEKQYVPYPATWLNAGSWEDEPLPVRGGRGQEKQRQALSLVERFQEEETHAEVRGGEAAGVRVGGGPAGSERALGRGLA